MSSSASSWPAVWSFSRVARIDSYPPNRSRIFASSQPSALGRTVTPCFALAVDAAAYAAPLVDLDLQPGPPARDHLAGVDVLVAGLVDLPVEVHARRADQLADHHALGAVDNEGALGRHEREIAHEHRLALDLASGVVDELRRHEHRGGVRHVLVLALLRGVLGRLEPVIPERERHGAGEVFDRADLLEDLFEAGLLGYVLAAGVQCFTDAGLPPLVAEQPVEGLGLGGEGG